MTVTTEYIKNDIPTNGEHKINGCYPGKEKPDIHPTSDAPLCKNCQELDLPFFDPSCPGCQEILQNLVTSISQIFAIIRQWVPQTQQNIDALINEILKRGAGVNDRDGLTDMTLLHYACKAGANGVGLVSTAAQTVGLLLDKGADVHLRCRWTDMSAVHYAVYFDVAPVLELLLKASKNEDVNSCCREFEGGTCLHIAATNLCLEVTRVLLNNGANPMIKDELGRTPVECIPDVTTCDLVPGLSEIAKTLRQLLLAAMPDDTICEHIHPISVSGRAMLQSMGLRLGDKVLVGGAKPGTMRFCGTTQFAAGIWAGIELDEPIGKNDGTLKGITYFICAPYHGIFAPITKVSKLDSSNYTRPTLQRSPSRIINHRKIDISHVTTKVDTGLASLRLRQLSTTEVKNIVVGDRVMITGQRKGTVVFCGEVVFSPGFWYGIELDKPDGKHDGTVQGIHYFTCKPGHGIFASTARISKLRKEDDNSDVESSTDHSLSISRASTDELSHSTNSAISYTRRSTRLSAAKMLQNSPNQQSDSWLTIGVKVFVNNEIGTLMYVGPVEFAEGVWLGVELGNPKGKNDGCIQGVRYFNCKPSHGLLVRPSRVTVHGINASKFFKDP